MNGDPVSGYSRGDSSRGIKADRLTVLFLHHILLCMEQKKVLCSRVEDTQKLPQGDEEGHELAGAV